jgi:hypothetical protein
MASMKPLVLRVCVQATDLSTGTGAGVRKPPKNETAGRHPADQRSGLETFPTFGTVFDGRPPLDFGCSCMDRQDARARRHAEQLTVGDDRPGHLGAVLVRVVAVADGIELAGDGAAEVGMGGVDLPEAQSGAQTTTQHILAGIDWAIAKGARIINMSFAGPYDPLLSQALKKAHEKGIVLIAAAGNAGPQSPPLYPAADENVIAVTAVDENDKLLPQANQGPHIALSAPGVNILETAPNASYEFTTGTSVATAHVSGVAALIIERNPAVDVAALEELLYSTARNLGPNGRDSQFGFGLVDPLHALEALEAKVAMGTTKPAPAATPLPRPFPASATSGMTVSQVPLAPGPGATNGETDFAPVAEKKRLTACLQEGTAKGIRGPELRDYTVVCVAEARLTCLKQAVAQKVRGPDRRDFAA